MTPLLTIEGQGQTAFLNSIATLARVFWGPDPESSREIRRGSFLKPFEDLGHRVTYPSPDLLSDLKNSISGFASADAIFQYLEEAYVRLFINSRQGTTAPLYASCYVENQTSEKNAPLMGLPAVLMQKRFETRGLSLSDSRHEPPDHLSIELEYLYFLLKRGWSDEDSVLLSEAVSFAGDDMLPWVSILGERIADESHCRFYPLIISVAVSILAFLSHQTPST
jgi:TorA-specific chaperone